LAVVLVAGFATALQFAGVEAVGDTPPWMEAISDPEDDGAGAVNALGIVGTAVPVAFALGTRARGVACEVC
jgi:hypothetical protein